MMDVKNEILQYINKNELCGALLLTGKWGSGKTYLLRELAGKVNKENTKLMVFVSLFGVNSVEELNRKIKSVVIHTALGNDEKRREKIDKFKSKFSGILHLASENFDSSGISKKLLSIDFYDYFEVTKKVPLSNRELVLVFDDFERSNIDAISRIGAINEYVENKGIHTIIVADEKKIDSKDYQEFKEKVIGKTISLSPDIAQIIPAIVEAYHEEKTGSGYKEFLKKNLNTIYFVFMESGLNNIRSLKAALVEFERVYLLWKDHNFPMDRLPDVLYSFCAVFFEYRTGKQQLGKMDEKYFRWGKNASHIAAIDVWIDSGRWNEKNIIEEITRNLFPPEISEEYKFLRYSPWDLEGKTIESALPVALEKAYSGEFSADETIAFLKKILFFKENKVDVLQDYDSQKFCHGWKLHEAKIKSGQIDGRESHSFMLPGEMNCADENEREVHERIEQFDRMLPSWETRKKLITGIYSGDISAYVSTNDYLNDLDDELTDEIICYFARCTNFERRILVSLLNNIDLSRIGFAGDKSITENNLRKFVAYLETVKNSTEDVIAQLAADTGIKLISNKLNGTYE